MEKSKDDTGDEEIELQLQTKQKEVDYWQKKAALESNEKKLLVKEMETKYE